ncbi:Ig-like domain-containing protein [Salinispira pacifica]|uniref:Ig-like domain-containing protein n=1 Tax=Salinispira pacifica TaxID=1307761 RepID=UPI0011839E95|nr:Ig-like domain-containing protein [Salinispira pacifica]
MIEVKAFKTVLTSCIFLVLLTWPVHAQEEAGAPGDSPTPADPVGSEGGSAGEEQELLNVPRQVDGLLQWRKQLDLSGLDPGRYNLLVTAEDEAGNILEAPPVDIRVDPESDLPRSSVTFPALNERVAGNFSALGSAVDDDAVSSVEYQLIPGDDPRDADASGFNGAEGKEFWSASIDVSDLEDGPYTIVSRAVDVNGLTGPETAVSFILDRNIPEITIESHENGRLVSGRLKVSGTLSDSNGVAAMHIRSGDQWDEIRLKGRDGAGERSFALDVDTREMEDGPRVLVFRAEDSQGSRSRASLLLFVDNTPPELEIVYPTEDLQADGNFSVLGRARDDNGIESLSWAYRGEEATEIAMEPGNPYWQAPVELSGADELDLEFVLTDPAGNSTNIRYRKELNVQADRPRISFAGALGETQSPGEEPDQTGEDELPSYRLGEQISGWVLDDDAPGAVIYSLNRGEEVRIDTPRSFTIDISDLPPGEHELRIRAEDIYGLQGEELSRDFLLKPRNPRVEMAKVLPRAAENGGNTGVRSSDAGEPGSRQPAGELAYEPGIGFRSDEYAGLEGYVNFHSGKGRIVASIPGRDDLELKLEAVESESTASGPERDSTESGPTESRNDSPGTQWKFTLPLADSTDTSLPYGYVPVKIRAIDELGSVSENIFPLWIENLSVYTGEPRLQLPIEATEMASGAAVPTGEAVVLGAGEVFDLVFFGQDVESAELTLPGGNDNPENDEAGDDNAAAASDFRLRSRGNRLSISARTSGILRGAAVRITTDRGTQYTRDLPVIISDLDAPDISLEDTAASSGVVRGTAEDDTEIRRLWYVSADAAGQTNGQTNQENGGTAVALDGDGSFEISVPDSEIVYPGSMITVYAEDAAGRIASRSLLVSGGAAPEEAGMNMRLVIPFFSSDAGLLPRDLHGDSQALPVGVVSKGSGNGRFEYAGNILISLNGGEPRSISGGPEAFTEFPFPGAGQHQLKAELPYIEFREGDDEGRERSVSASVSFTIAPETGTLVFADRQLEEIPRFSGEEPAAITGTFDYDGKIEEAVYVLDGGEEIELNLSSRDAGGYAFAVPLENRDRSLRAGRHGISLRISDEFGREVTGFLDFHLRESTENRIIDDREGWYPVEEKPGSYIYLFNGRPPEAARTATASASGDGSVNVDGADTARPAGLPAAGVDQAGSSWIVRLTPAEVLRWEELKLELETVDGQVFDRTIDGVSFDTLAPELILNTPVEGENLNVLRISGTAADNDAFGIAAEENDASASSGRKTSQNTGGLPVLSYSLNGNNFRVLTQDSAVFPSGSPDNGASTGENDPAAADRNAGRRGAFSFAIGAEELIKAGADQGPLELTVRAEDASGNFTTVRRLLTLDTEGPEIEQILPGDEVVNGRNSLFFLVWDQFSHEPGGRFALAVPAAGNGESDGAEAGDEAPEDAAEETSEEAADEIELKFEEKQSEHGVLEHLLDLSPYAEFPRQVYLELSDSAGNTRRRDVDLNFDPASDKPKISMEFPEEDALFESDALFSGTVIDDDGVDSIRYRLDDGEYRRADTVEGANSFEIRIPFEELEDNEHVLDVIAVDIYGVESDVLSTPFRVSREKPRAQLLSPELGSTNGGTVTLEGSASDANGIESVWISLDGGNSFQQTRGGETWSYDLDSSILVDRSYLMLIKAVDGYGVESVSSSIITLDNTPPAMELSLPREGSEVEYSLPVQLRVSDELTVADIRYQITRLLPDATTDTAAAADDDGNAQEQQVGGETMLGGYFEPRRVVLEQIDISGLEPGLYNLSIFARDDAENESMVSRDIIRVIPENEGRLALLHPFDGSRVSGHFTLEGRAYAVDGEIPSQVVLTMDGSSFDVLKTDDNGYFSRSFEPGEIADGSHLFRILPDTASSADSENGGLIPRSRIDYRAEGPWVSIDSMGTGDFASQRPWISGRTGYFRESGPDGASEADEMSRKEQRELEKQYELVSLEYSLDNGSSFTSMRPREEWKFRLETQDLNDGPLSVMVRSRFASGETAVSRIFTRVDDTLPSVSIITPEENIALNEELEVSGTAWDANGLKDVQLTLRPRSKNSYEVPQFIQGLYVDLHVLGATYWEAGLGLTFFDNNVKLQVLGGQAPEGRFNGNVLGLKLLANVASLPYGFLFGPDWEFLSSSLAVGSAFQYFTMDSSTSQGSTEADGLVLGAVIVQLELLKVEIEKWNAMNAYAAYVENQFWFISSDIQGGIKYRLAFGMRINLF